MKQVSRSCQSVAGFALPVQAIDHQPSHRCALQHPHDRLLAGIRRRNRCELLGARRVPLRLLERDVDDTDDGGVIDADEETQQTTVTGPLLQRLTAQ